MSLQLSAMKHMKQGTQSELYSPARLGNYLPSTFNIEVFNLTSVSDSIFL